MEGEVNGAQAHAFSPLLFDVPRNGVIIPPMVGSTWLRVAYVIRSDCPMLLMGLVSCMLLPLLIVCMMFGVVLVCHILSHLVVSCCV